METVGRDTGLRSAGHYLRPSGNVMANVPPQKSSLKARPHQMQLHLGQIIHYPESTLDHETLRPCRQSCFPKSFRQYPQDLPIPTV